MKMLEIEEVDLAVMVADSSQLETMAYQANNRPMVVLVLPVGSFPMQTPPTASRLPADVLVLARQ